MYFNASEIHNICDDANAYNREFWFLPHCHVSGYRNSRGKQINHLGTKPIGPQSGNHLLTRANLAFSASPGSFTATRAALSWSPTTTGTSPGKNTHVLPPPPFPAQRRNEFHPSGMKPGARGQETVSEVNSTAVNYVVSFE